MDAKANPVQIMLSVLLLCLYLKIRISHAADAITAEQSLSGDQTIVSAGGVFELGFFKPGKLSHYYIGMWYNKQKQVASVKPVVVWVANREHPVSDILSSVLRISEGNLVLFNESKRPIWSTNITFTNTLGPGTSMQAILLDNGNLVLRPESSSSQPLWQSFDHLADTFLPGSRIGFNTVTKQTQTLTSWKKLDDPSPGYFSLGLDPDGSNSYVLCHEGKTIFTSGFWNERKKIFSSIPEMGPKSVFNYSYVTNENESYFTYSDYDPNTTSRLVLDYTGQIMHLIFSEISNQWMVLWSLPRDICDTYALCGAFSFCSLNSSPVCQCLNGFVPKSPSDWSVLDFTEGCSRRISLQCENAIRDNAKKDVFIQMLSKPSSADTQFQEVNSTEECESICSNDCECTAYAYANKTGCSTWSQDILENQNGSTLHFRVTSSFEKDKGHVAKRSLVIAVVSATAGLLIITFGYFLWKKRSRMERKYGETISKDGGENDTELPLFGLRSILTATNNFSEANRLGEGGFGPVYKGIFIDNQEVAVKRLSKYSGQGYKEFMNELKLIAKLQHTNLVRLLGSCIEEEERILIYEYMPNRSLDKFLFDSSKNTKLDWGNRFRIIKGISHGVLYIHKYSRLKIIHRDLKASNILLDEEMNPKISDFGMAKIIEINQTEANTNRVVGTYGYMSPEYALYGHFSEKLDVFSFGVLLLEIVTGKRNAAFRHFEHSPTLAGWAWKLWKEGREVEVIDASIRETCQPQEALRCIQVGFLCVQEDPVDRPTMSTVIRILQGNATTSLPVSKEPAFSTHCDSNTLFSNNAVTISIPEGR